MPDGSALSTLTSLTGSVISGGLTAAGFMLCMAASLLFGIVSAMIYKSDSRRSRNFIVTLALLPSIVQIIIMLVNGNIGVGVAVAGAFSLVRFRSVPGNSHDILAIFLAMALGFICGMGYLFFGFVFLLIFCAAGKILYALPFTAPQQNIRIMEITVPADTDYDGLLAAPFGRRLQSFELDSIKTTGEGRLFELTYRIQLKDNRALKSFIDELCALNGGLKISISKETEVKDTKL